MQSKFSCQVEEESEVTEKNKKLIVATEGASKSFLPKKGLENNQVDRSNYPRVR